MKGKIKVKSLFFLEKVGLGKKKRVPEGGGWVRNLKIRKLEKPANYF
jgi:hypothetical protein